MVTDTCPSALPSVEFFAMLTMDFLSSAVLVLAKPFEPRARPLECLQSAKHQVNSAYQCLGFALRPFIDFCWSAASSKQKLHSKPLLPSVEYEAGTDADTATYYLHNGM
jgi:hypothetical protein